MWQLMVLSLCTLSTWDDPLAEWVVCMTSNLWGLSLEFKGCMGPPHLATPTFNSYSKSVVCWRRDAFTLSSNMR